MSRTSSADKAFKEQRENDDVLEIDHQGRIYQRGEGPRYQGRRTRKPSVLRDPKGEYGLQQP